MARKIIIVIILFSILNLTIPKYARGLDIPPDIGTGSQVPTAGTGLSCTGPWTKIICVVKKVADIIITIQNIASNILSWIPHQFPFGGPILSSEQACTLHFRSTTWLGETIPFTTLSIVYPVIIPVDLGLDGRAIEVGPPVPSGGKVIAFPWISKIYDNHTENRAGPWALGLGFTPFPIDEINVEMGKIHIWIPPQIVDRSCLIPDPRWFFPPIPYPIFPPQFIAQCFDDFSFECVPSGEKDLSGKDIYKVIRLLGTSEQDVPAADLQQLKTSFPTFPWP